MSYRKITESPTGYYHVMNRGDGRQILFENQSDYLYFLKRLVNIRENVDFELSAYCLMDNHFHLLIYTTPENLTTLMLRLDTSYAKYYNTKYDHFGHVFQGRYNCKAIDSSHYLEACVRYIHNNPVEAKLCSREKYAWSSFNDYISGKGITDTRRILETLGGVDSFKAICEAKDDKYIDCVIFGSLNEDRMLENGKILLKGKYGIDNNVRDLVKGLPKVERDSIIRDLKTIGLSANAIERLTGISKSIIARA